MRMETKGNKELIYCIYIITKCYNFYSLLFYNFRRVDRLLKLILRVISQYQFRIDINWMTELCSNYFIQK